MEILDQLLRIAGSLGLFLIGMKTMSDGIQKAAGERLQSILNFMTGSRVTAVGTGILITVLVQSSSATTVMVVSLVNAALLTLRQAIGVIMGANIGTTFTGWIVAIFGFRVDVTVIALPAIGIGLPFLYWRKIGRREIGEILCGFGMLFLGLGFLKDSVPDIRSHPEVLEFLALFTGSGLGSLLLFILIGTLLTIIVQSSSAAMAITLTMAYAGWIDYQTSAAIILGENIGTTVTAYLASITAGRNARRASRAHTLFNIFGVFWMLFLFQPFLSLVNFIVPGDITAPGNIRLLPAHLAMFHTLFNIVNTAVCIGFTPFIEKAVEKLVPGKDEIAGVYSLKYLSTSLQDTPELYVHEAKKEMRRMASIVGEMFSRFVDFFYNPSKNIAGEAEALKKMEDYTDQMQEEISRFLLSCSSENLTAETARTVNSMIRIIHELEQIGDACFNLIILAERRYRKKIELSEESLQELVPYTELVQNFITFIQTHLNQRMNAEDLQEALKLENGIDTLRNSLKKAARKRLQRGSEVKGELLYIDIVNNVEHIGDYCLNIAEALRNIGR